jgi:pimeloyl-ACP methyl ester carboxylesterase
MNARSLIGIVSAAVSGATATFYLRYRAEMRSMRDALERGSKIARTASGEIEFAESGAGEPALVIHGAGGGYDQGLLIGRDLGHGFRVIAPSRFGYLRTPVPADSSPAAQADAHAALLDFLGVTKAVVVGVSAGAPSAIEFAIRHPGRVSTLILLVPRTYDPTRSMGIEASAANETVLRLIEGSADFLFWLAIHVARASVVRFLGVPPDLEQRASDEERARVTELMRSILPLSSRVRGLEVDSGANLAPWPLERIEAATLIVSARDDLFRTLPGARFTADHIKGAELHVLDSGGHLMVGQTAQVRAWTSEFLGRHRSTRVHGRRVAKVLEPVR